LPGALRFKRIALGSSPWPDPPELIAWRATHSLVLIITRFFSARRHCYFRSCPVALTRQYFLSYTRNLQVQTITKTKMGNIRTTFITLTLSMLWATIWRAVNTNALAVPLTFYIKSGEEGAQLVKLTTKSNQHVVCEFKYATRSPSVPAADDLRKVDEEDLVPKGENILARLAGICIRKTIDYWKYEVCFEGQIKQTHGDTMQVMGRYAGVEGSLQLYDEVFTFFAFLCILEKIKN